MKTKKGQILIITLLVLTIVAIVTVSLVSLVNRDVQQVASTQQYEDAYNTSETQLKKVLDSFGNPKTDLSNIGTTLNNSADINCDKTTIVRNEKIYECNISNKDFSTTTLQTTVTVQDTSTVNDFQIYKDRTFDMNLAGYLGTLDFYWDKNAAIEFEVVYTDASGVIQSVRDVYDAGSPRIYTSLGADTPTDATTGIHPFKFKVFAGQSPATSVEIKLSDIVDLNGVAITSPTTLKITPRMTDDFGSINLNAADATGGLPKQVRVFTSTSYNATGGASTPVANIQTKIPLAAQPDSVLNSSIVTNGILKNSP